jgi:uncharacterized protein (TIGR04141 family)
MARTETISVYLLKPFVGRPEDALKESGAEEPVQLARHRLEAGETRGAVFVREADAHEPDWVGLLKPVTEPPVETMIKGAGALVVLEAAGRWFAIAFGSGRFLLDRGVYERRFGLRVALNAVDPEQLRGAQARTFTDYALHTHRQVSRLSPLDALELDAERDLVTALEGTPEDQRFGKRVAGRDAVQLTAEIEAGELAAKCAELLTKSRETHYSKAFPWIDNIEELTDPADVAAVENEACTALGQRNFAGFDLYPPELVSAEIVRYRLSPRARDVVVVEPGSSLLRYPLRGPLSAHEAKAALQRYKLIGLDASGQEVGRWSFWDCLHYEISKPGSTLVLDNGQWYRIAQSFVTDVERFAEGLTSSQLSWPPAMRAEDEDAYNEGAAISGDFALLHGQSIRLPGQTAIEPCDLFSADRHMVHVKRRKGGSRPFSHLLGQALVAAECLVREPEFREQLRGRLSGARPGYDGLIPEPVDARHFSVVLALIMDAAPGTAPAEGLPFFSKVFLRQVVRRIQMMGFDVYVDAISRQTQLPSGPRRRPRRTPVTRPQPIRAGA